MKLTLAAVGLIAPKGDAIKYELYWESPDPALARGLDAKLWDFDLYDPVTAICRRTFTTLKG